MTKSYHFFPLCALGLLLACCAETPLSRISQHPDTFAKVAKEYKPLVESGSICAGMTPDAVYLAWGAPSSVVEGQMSNKFAMRWIYNSLEAVHTTSVMSPFLRPYGPGPYYMGRGPYGPYGPPAAWADIAYVPVNVGYVLFANGKVTAWERRK